MKRLENIVIKSVNHLHTVSSPKGRVEVIRERRNYGLSFCLGGQITYELDGKRTVSDPMHAVIHPRGKTYTLYGDKAGEFPLIDFNTADDIGIDEFISLRLNNPESYIHDFKLMSELSIFPHNRLRVIGIFYGMLDRLLKETALQNDILAPVLDYIENHYRDCELSNELLASQANISEVYMRQLFRRQMRTSPRQYILELRMQKARQLLCESGDTVSEIAVKCGFSSLQHFCRAFRAASGTSPSEYRTANRRILL